MEFVLTGFHQTDNVRRYVFQGVAEDRKPSEFSVGVDLALIYKHRIPMQELPLLCRSLLEGSSRRDSGVLMFTEKDMLGYASRRAAAQELAERRRRGHHRPPVPSRAKTGGSR
jgi:hypothetical protein